MKLVALVVSAALALTASFSPSFANAEGGDGDMSRGFNSDLKWLSLEDAKAKALDTGKPMMVLIHKSWCGACKSLKEHFKDGVAGVDEIKRLSKKFVLANVEDEEEPNEEQYKPDGDYIPRIFFADSFGQVDPEIYNTLGSDEYKYFYGDGRKVIEGMKAAIQKFSVQASSASKDNAAAAASTPSIADQIKDLAALHGQGLLSDDEFATAKARVLGALDPPQGTIRHEDL